MDLIHVLELDTPSNVRICDTDAAGAAAPVLRVHAAAPDVVQTLCGRATRSMTREPAHGGASEESWWPARWRHRVCPVCAVLLPSTGPAVKTRPGRRRPGGPGRHRGPTPPSGGPPSP
ncbi:hypothetical protein KNE206_70610 [Kitasatospora sp. NE20-6]|uniref:hypothetical protein n=1 Tax=Kitasatospora sp. NE20-6 TaxID=2859066 RepID=UPI0034DBF852